jgi:hypothetical protein
MSTTVRDASWVTQKNRQKALFAWKSDNTTQVNLGLSVRQEQPTFQSLEVVVQRQQGGCKCTTDRSANPYQFNGLSQCGCGAAQ